MREPDPIDFKTLIAEILSEGITAYKFCLMMHVDKKQLKRWLRGIEPAHYQGVMILMIHAEYVSKKETIIQEEKAEIATA